MVHRRHRKDSHPREPQPRPASRVPQLGLGAALAFLVLLGAGCGETPRDPEANTANWPADITEPRPQDADGPQPESTRTRPPATRLTPPPDTEAWLASCAVDYESGLPTAVAVTNTTQTAQSYTIEVTFTSNRDRAVTGISSTRTGLLQPGAVADKPQIGWSRDNIVGGVECTLGRIDRTA
ncbi:hypothetical protein I6A84_04520 [Frankia sp. CNm7]|uniref:Uncharacterized protein n=1 Tax=Frankia nepalensis TaxID=1836974 RepID=A0A937UJX7_9ACTN|nr:hypothetical protein [Frankia nepalensis]MBL7498731.1 hypothetical protein [Frankia nepalensis]MBL7508404.1 hypothetical protein [Frankia nepalensis]MBL7517404.1 hypothetical protein [Frankia nepalensis]MBL7626234.1 hypothetical protein [Frankia nepalensis]